MDFFGKWQKSWKIVEFIPRFLGFSPIVVDNLKAIVSSLLHYV